MTLEFDEDGRLIMPETKIDSETYSSLNKEALEFENTFNQTRLNKAHSELEEFNKKFPISKIEEFELKDYCYGYKGSFCWWVEEGSIDVAHTGHDGFNREYGIWFSDKEKQYYTVEGVRSIPISEETAKSKLSNIKTAIVSIIHLAKNNKFEEIREEKLLWHQVKAKIAYLYFPDKFLPILSKEHLELMCGNLGLVGYNSEDHLKSSHELLNSLRKIDSMKEWHSLKIAMFLYSKFKELHKDSFLYESSQENNMEENSNESKEHPDNENNLIEGYEEDEALDLQDKVKELYWKPWEPSVGELCSKKQEGELILQPYWQRDFVWDQKKASRLIESILINVPLPVIYFDEDKDKILTVIDGQQRLTSLISFIEGKFRISEEELIDFKLKGLDVLSNLNGKKFSELDKVSQRTIKNTPIKCIVIEAKSHPDIKFEIFERLNTGAVKLNDDELRNSIYRGKYINLLRELSSNETFQRLLNRKQFRKRMLDRGMILRFLAFYNRTYLKYKPSIKQFLNNELEENENLEVKKEQEYKNKFSHAVEMTNIVFGDKAFRRYVPGDNQNLNGAWATTRVNMALFDIVMWGFTNYEKSQIVPHADTIREELLHLMTHNQEFIDSIMIQTSGKEQVQKRFEIWKDSLNKIIGTIGKREPRAFTLSLKKELFELDNSCKICGQTIHNMDDAEVDHIEHYWRGGKTIPENARLTHRYCNRQRGGRN